MRRIVLFFLLPLSAFGWQSAVGQRPQIPAHMRFEARLKSALNSKTAKVGDPVTVEVTYPGRAGKDVVIAKHSLLQGSVVSVLPYQKKHVQGGLAIKFTELDTPTGARVPLEAVVFQAYLDKNISLGDAMDTTTNHDMPGADIPGDFKLNMTSAEAVKGLHGLSLFIVGGDASAFMQQYGDVKIGLNQPILLRMVTVPPKQ